MLTILYTDSDRVLSVTGLSPEDVSDPFIESKDLQRMLSVDLFPWLPTHATLYNESQALTATETQKYYGDCLILYCTYFCASKVVEALLGIMSKETDGQNEYNRFSSVDLRQLAQDLLTNASRYRHTLTDALASNPVPNLQQFTVVAPTYDPVTG